MKLISNQINPHFTLSDALTAAGQIFSWKNPDLTNRFPGQFVLTNTARTALGIIADQAPLDRNKKIALPAFICGVVATPFLERGWSIEWIDTDQNGLIDPADFAQKADGITLVVVPHIFGQPAPLASLKKIAEKHQIMVVEDGAHLLNNNFDHCDVKIWSFGREKVISCVSGGALIWPAKSKSLISPELPKASFDWQIKHALQPLIYALALGWWHQGGKILPALSRKLKILPLAVTAAEKNGHEDVPMQAMGKVQKRILAKQWEQQTARTQHAQAIAQAWKKYLTPRLPTGARMIIPDSAFRVIVTFTTPAEKEAFVSTYFNRSDWHLRDWDGVPISPQGVDLKAFGYEARQCPQAEHYAQTYLTLPTNIRVSKKDLKQLEKA